MLLFYRNRSNRGNSSPPFCWSMIPLAVSIPITMFFFFTWISISIALSRTEPCQQLCPGVLLEILWYLNMECMELGTGHYLWPGGGDRSQMTFYGKYFRGPVSAIHFFDAHSWLLNYFSMPTLWTSKYFRRPPHFWLWSPAINNDRSLINLEGPEK